MLFADGEICLENAVYHLVMQPILLLSNFTLIKIFNSAVPEILEKRPNLSLQFVDNIVYLLSNQSSWTLSFGYKHGSHLKLYTDPA